MANTLTVIQDRLLAQTLMSFRNSAPFLMSANRNYEDLAKSFGTTVDIPRSEIKVAANVTPSGNRSDTLPSSTRTQVQLTLDQWKKTNFSLTDKENGEINAGRDFIPSESEDAIAGLVEVVEDNIAGNYVHAYQFTGTAGTTPFATTADASIQANKILNDARAGKANRRFIMDTSAEANALALSTFADAEKTMENGVKIEAALGRKYGFFNQASTNVQTHTLGAATGGVIASDGGTESIGDTVMHIDGLTTKPSEGDLFTIAGDTQQYVIVSATTLVGADSDITFQPPLVVAPDDGDVLTFIATHVANLAFHKNALTFANRPVSAMQGSQANYRTMTDSVTGLTVRLGIDEAYKATIWEFDILYGSTVPQAEGMVRVLG